MRITNKIITAVIAAAMLMSTAPVMPMATPVSSVTAYADATIGEKLTACTTGTELDEVLNSMTSEECTELGISMDGYASLTAPIFAADAMIKATYTAENFAEVFNDVMADMLYTEVIDNSDLGANYNPTSSTDSSIKLMPGVEIKTTQITNGFSTSVSGGSGYVMYNEISNPSAITSIRADITGNNKGAASGAGNRGTKIIGYSTVLPQYRENTTSNGTAEYALDSDAFNSWTEYIADFNEVTEETFTFAVESFESNTVTLNSIKAGLNAITSDTTPLVLRFSNGSAYQRINNLKLTITYDKTILLKQQHDSAALKGVELAACVQAAELDAALKALTDEEIDLLGIDVEGYKSLAYPTIAADAILKQEYSDYAGFETAFDNVMAEMLYTEVIDNFDLGANYNPTSSTDSNIKLMSGVEIKTTQITNGYSSVSGASGYVMYNEISNPSAITSIFADITGNNKGAASGAGNRGTKITGYSTALPKYKENTKSNGTAEYALDSDEFNSWTEYIADFNEVTEETFTFAVDSSASNTVALKAIKAGLNAVTTDITPLVLRFSNGIAYQRINNLKLTITYDNTIIIKTQQDSYDALVSDILDCETADELDTVLQSMTSSEAETLGLDLTGYTSLAYPEYAAEAIIAETYSDIDTFKTAFDKVMAEMIYDVTIENYDISASYNDTGSAQNDNSIYNGIAFTASGVQNGYYGEKGYFIYNEIANPSAITNLKINRATSKTKGSRTSYVTGYSTVTPPYIGGVYAKVEPDSETFQLWTEYINGFTKATSAPFTCNVDDGVTTCENTYNDALVGLNAVAANTTTLVLEIAKPDGINIGTDATGVMALTLTYDKTVVLYNIENGFNEVITAVNAVTDDTADADVLAVIDSYLSSILTDSTLTDKFNRLANSVQIQIIKDLSAQKNAEISGMQSAMAELVTAAEDVEIKYNVTAFPFLNYTDAGANADECVGWVREMTVKKLTNSTEDFVIVLAAYSGGVLTDVALIDKDNVPTNSQYANTYTTLKNAKDGEEQTIYIGNFFTEFQPDAVKVLVLNSLGNLRPIAEVYEVADPKAIKTAE